MQTLIEWTGTLLGFVIRPCYRLTHNYGLAILLFVVFSKIVLIPVSVWVQKNGIKLVTMQPEINWLKVNRYGDLDAIAEEQAKIYKRYKYNALASVVPLLIQLVLLLGLVQVIYNPLKYIAALPADVIAALVGKTAELTGVDAGAASAQMAAAAAARDPALREAFLALSARLPGADMPAVLDAAGIDMRFLGLDLSWIPLKKGGATLAVPVLAALSAWVMCVCQNRAQVLQAEQGKLNKYGTMAVSVGLSLYLGMFVPAGVGLYWIASNLLAIAQLYILNAVIDPRKSVDYAELERSRRALAELDALGGSRRTGPFSRDPNARRERQDYRRFFSVLNKHVVFYSEKSGFWKYFRDIAEQLLARTNLRIHYVTNDPDDQVFEYAKTQPRLVPYYIGPKRIITLMMKMDADMVVMTTPDLETFHIKRSYVRKDVEYVYTPHDLYSVHMGFREGAWDHFDTILCAGPNQMAETRALEKLRGTPEKTLVPCGYCQIDDLIRDYAASGPRREGRRRILIAPTWNEDNILDSCIDGLLESLLGDDRLVIVRPHPEYVKRFRPRMDQVVARWASRTGEGLQFELDFSSNRTIWEADVLVTDWSAIALEFSFTTLRPTLFINTKMKVLNPNWEQLGITPQEILLRDRIGVSVAKDDSAAAEAAVRDMLGQPDRWSRQIEQIRGEYVFNLGHCGEHAANYIIGRLAERRRAGKAD